MATALAALGSNLGERTATLETAVDQLRRVAGIDVRSVSRWYETQPAGGPAGQAAFLNGAAWLETSLSPQQLWHAFQQVEQAAARQREIAWGPRTLDIDLLMYDDLVLDSPGLVIPHPRMMFRRFVMEPAAEIAPALVHPLLGWRLDEINRHLALARNFIALFAPPGVSTRELAQQLQQEFAATLIEDPVSSGSTTRSASPLAAQPYQFSTADCLTNIERQAALVSRTRWGEAGIASHELLLSGFWLGESVVEAAAWLAPADAELVQTAYQSALPGTIRPKLVVCLYGDDSSTERESALKTESLATSPGSRPCGIQLNREQLAQWRNSARTLLSSGQGGPWLMLDANRPAAVCTEVVAAALAMR